MKRYLFLKLGLTILVYTAVATARNPVPHPSLPGRGNVKRNIDNQSGSQSLATNPKSDTKTIQDYQGVMGKPGVDFPVLTYIPRTKFNCRGKKSGYYADLDTNCQVFHICDEGRKVSFLCPNGTIFQQSDLICDWWFKVDCATAPSLYDESAEQLHEENLRRKENRKVQHQQLQERRSQKTNNIQQETFNNANANRQGREFTKSRNSKNINNNHRENLSNYSKKDVNQYTSTSHTEKTSTYQYSREDYSSYKETQIPSETASFVGNRYNEQQKNYYKTYNEIKTTTQNYVQPPVSQKFDSEKISRGSRTFNSTSANNKAQYRNQVPEIIKTTTQHTIYSPTVPPFTSSTRRPVTTTANYQAKSSLAAKITKPLSGFYITKELKPATTTAPFVSGPVYTSAKVPIETTTFNYFTTTTKKEEILELHTTPETVNRPLIASEIIAGSHEILDSDFSNGIVNSRNTANTETNDITTTETSRNPKQINFINLSTLPPFEETTIGIQNTIIPSVPTPFKSSSIKDSSSTSKFNKFTYLPKSETKLPTPKPTIPTEYTTFVTDPTVTENLSNMIKTLKQIEGENATIEMEKYLSSRPGLHIPPSAGPKTLHSLAIYFATALDNLVSPNDTTENYDEENTTTDSDGQVNLLSRITQDKYNSLFDVDAPEINSTDDSNYYSTNKNDIDLRTLVEHDTEYNDLDRSQSRGPVSSSTPRIRQLAQVFTQALSAYLDDPDTFKKVLEEIRPTEPPIFVDDTTHPPVTTLPTTITTEYRSYTKEEDEVLDFSDADKSSTYRPYSDNFIKTTQSAIYSSTIQPYFNRFSTTNAATTTTKVFPTPNPLAIHLNNGLKLSTSSSLQDIEDDETTEDATESQDYFPFNTGEDEEEAKRRATAKPYGLGVKPSNSTPITIPPETTVPTTENIIFSRFNLPNNNNKSKPFDDLLPPFKISLNYNDEQNNSFTANEEYLQSAHSQSFLSHKNNINNERSGKNIKLNTNADISTTEFYRDTTIYTTPTNEYTTTQNSASSTQQFDTETTTNYYSFRQYYDDFTTTTELPSTTTESSTTSIIPDTTTNIAETTTARAVPDNHWSTSPEVAKLWETTLYVNPLIINRNLGTSGNLNDESSIEEEFNSVTTYRPEFSTQSLQTTTNNDYADESIIDLKFTSTTGDPLETTTNLDLNSPQSTIIDLGIHSLLNTSELEIANSQAQQIFGNLNSTEQDILIEKMKEAESNSTVRRLILLLVSTCDASLSHNKTVQETRNSILQALLNVPSSKEINQNSRNAKQINFDVVQETTTTLTPDVETKSTFNTPETTFRQNEFVSKIESPSKAQEVKDVHQDTRALELLRSLYSLAAKWGKK